MASQPHLGGTRVQAARKFAGLFPVVKVGRNFNFDEFTGRFFHQGNVFIGNIGHGEASHQDSNSLGVVAR
jgi:hypothetical protein